MNKKTRVSVFGGTGYTGVELIRLLLNHPNVEIYQITSRNDKGKGLMKFIHHLEVF